MENRKTLAQRLSVKHFHSNYYNYNLEIMRLMNIPIYIIVMELWYVHPTVILFT